MSPCAIARFALPLLLTLAALPAPAQLFRAYLTLDGNDANPCTLVAPCRLLPAALAAVASGGEIWMLDSANYNTSPVSITKAVTILAVPGALGSVVALGGTAITVSTDGAVTLRNLNVLPFPGSETEIGVNKQGAGRLTIQDCSISGLSLGVAVGGAASATIARSTFRGNATGVFADNGAAVGISDSLFADNTLYGATAATTTSALTTTLSVARSVARANGVGFTVATNFQGSSARLFVADSVMDSNVDVGVGVSAPAGTSAFASVSNNMIASSSVGAAAGGAGNSRLLLSGNTIAGNTIGVLQGASSIVESAGNNALRNNGADVSGTMTNIGTM